MVLLYIHIALHCIIYCKMSTRIRTRCCSVPLMHFFMFQADTSPIYVPSFPSLVSMRVSVNASALMYLLYMHLPEAGGVHAMLIQKFQV
jgi:hypothetical protein